MKAKKMIIRSLKALAWTIGIVIILLALALWAVVKLISPENLTRYAEYAANEYLDAQVDIGRVELTAYSTFPILHIDIDSLNVVQAITQYCPQAKPMPTHYLPTRLKWNYHG